MHAGIVMTIKIVTSLELVLDVGLEKLSTV